MTKDDEKSDLEECAAMNIATTSAARDPLTRNLGFPARRTAGDFNVAMRTTNPLLPADRQWAIRFNAGGTVTIVLGMRNYGRGWYSAHFATLAANRLGLPFCRMRVYYSANLPAVLQTPRESGVLPEGSRPGPLAAAVSELIEEMCGRTVEKGRSIFAELVGAATTSVGFDQAAGCFFARDGVWRASILNIAEVANGGGASWAA